MYGETEMINEKPNGLHLMFPFPDAILNPNKIAHWTKKASAKKTSKTAGYYLAKEKAVILDSEKRYIVKLVFCPPDNRKRDLDNLLASMKSALDGMCSGLGIDDSMIKPDPDWGPVTEGGKVEITIMEKIEPESRTG